MHAVVAHISKSKCTKHTILGPLLEVQMSKKCTPLWREAHFQVKMYKARGVGPLFDDAMGIRCRKNDTSARCCGAKHIWKSKVSKTATFEPILMELLKLVQLVKFVGLVELVSY